MTRILITLLLAGLLGTAQAQNFTYRGSLEDGGEPAQGRYQLRISLYADRLGNEALSAPLELNDVTVTDGRFAVGLDFPDLPPGLAAGWLEVAVKAENDQWVTLDGRSEVGLNNLVCPTPWGLEGNAGTNAAINFLGTTDDQPLVVRVGNERVARFSKPEFFSRQPNILFGSEANGLIVNDLGEVRSATVAGGGTNTKPNRAATQSSVGGGIGNVASGESGTVGGGEDNTASSRRATVGGGANNTASGGSSTVSGGVFNFAIGGVSAVGGGAENVANGDVSTIAGGSENRAFGRLGTVSGGTRNSADGESSTVSGGSFNSAGGAFGSVSGGDRNDASGRHSTVSGGSSNCAGGLNSWAGGNRAKVRPGSASGPAGFGCLDLAPSSNADGDKGTFIWADSQQADFVSTGENQFLIRASGGMGLGTNAPQAHLHVDGPLTSNGLRIDLNGSPKLLVASNGGTTIGGNTVPPPNGLHITGVLRTNLSSSGNTTVCRNAGFELGTCSSSIRYKQNIQTIEGEEALHLLQQLRPVRYEWIESGRADIGLVAEEVAELIPAIVTYNADGQIEGFEYNRLGPLLVAGFQEQQSLNHRRFAGLESAHLELGTNHAELTAENAQLRAEVAALEASNAVLANRLTALEQVQAEELDKLRAELALLRELLLPAVAGMQ